MSGAWLLVALCPTLGPQTPHARQSEGFCEHDMKPLIESAHHVSYVGKLRPSKSK